MDAKSMARTRMDCMKRRAVEIKEALWILKKSHGLSLCQVWIPKCVKVENEEGMLKLGGYYVKAFEDYYNACEKIQDGSGGLAEKAYETYQAYFSKNLKNNIIKGKLQALIPATAAESSYCCLGICLRNSYNGDFDYAFEFIFKSYDNNNNNPCVFLESLFSKLESCLSNFKFSSGAQIGRELLVLDVDNPTTTSSFNIFSTKKQQGEVDCKGHLLRRWKNIEFGQLVHRASVEIKEAISFLADSHALTLAQVWMYPYYVNITKNENVAVKIDGYYADGFKDYYDACRRIHHGAGGLTLKTLVTHLPYFSRNVVVSAKLQALLPSATSSSSKSTTCCLAVCLRNVYTGLIDYAFEFLFSLQQEDDNDDPCGVFLESILVTLEKCLPSFKLSNGARLSRDIPVLDGDKLAVTFDMLAFIKQEEDDCMEKIFLYTNDEGRPIFAMDVSAASVKLADLKTKISQRFNLVSNAYRLSYLGSKGKGSTGLLWVQLKGDEDMKKCIRFCTRQKITRLLLRVLPCTISTNQLPNPDSQNEGGGVRTQLPAKRRHIA